MKLSMSEIIAKYQYSLLDSYLRNVNEDVKHQIFLLKNINILMSKFQRIKIHGILESLLLLVFSIFTFLKTCSQGHPDSFADVPIGW